MFGGTLLVPPQLETERELLTLGLEEMADAPDALVLVEWGEKFASVVERAAGGQLTCIVAEPSGVRSPGMTESAAAAMMWIASSVRRAD